MSENVELIAASDLPTTDAKEVDVLCVENGELKRKAGATLGGAGGYVVYIDDSMVTVDADTGDINITYSGSYDDFADIWYEGGHIQFDFTNATSTIGGIPLRATPLMSTFMDGVFMFLVMFSGEETQITCATGTWTPPTA